METPTHFNVVVDWPDGDSQIIETGKDEPMWTYAEAYEFLGKVVDRLRADGSDAIRATVIAGSRVWI